MILYEINCSRKKVLQLFPFLLLLNSREICKQNIIIVNWDELLKNLLLNSIYIFRFSKRLARLLFDLSFVKFHYVICKKCYDCIAYHNTTFFEHLTVIEMAEVSKVLFNSIWFEKHALDKNLAYDVCSN